MFDAKEMQTKFISNMAERLNTMNFRARFREDGDLTVSSSINFLGVVGKTGELYCNSKDLCNPHYPEFRTPVIISKKILSRNLLYCAENAII